MKTQIVVHAVCVCLAKVAFCGGAGDVLIQTSHPQYPGEGAFQTVDDCVAFATRNQTDVQDKAIAMYKWFLTHQWHLMSPMEWCVPGRAPDTADPGNYETVVFDANRARFSYGYGLCGTTHAWNEVYWKAMGLRARRREFPNHINSEVFYQDEWHAFDSDMAGLIFRPDGVVAGYADLQKQPGLINNQTSRLPHYPFDWPNDFETMKRGWQQVAEKKNWYSLHNGGYASHPGIVQLRSGESFTRWFDRDHYGGPSRRRFWHNQPGGPERNWSFLNTEDPFHEGKNSNARNIASYCNGEFAYEPPLHSEACRDSLVGNSNNIGFRKLAPRLYSTDGKLASATFRHFSPYVICGDPEDDANPMTGRATDGFVIHAKVKGTIKCEVSADQGQSWSVVPQEPVQSATNDNSLRVDLTEFVKGRYGWQVRFSWHGDSGVDSVKFTTTTQVCQAMYPRLTANGCTVNYKSTPRAVVAMIPNFGLAEEQIGKFEVKSLRTANLKYTPRSVTNRYAFKATNNKPAAVVFKIAAPTELQEVRAAVRYQLPVPPTAGCDVRLEVSTDAGLSWQEFAKAEIPDDNEFSSGWLAGIAKVTANPAREAWVRVRFQTPGRPAALIDARLYGIHQVKPPEKVSVQLGWLQDGKRLSKQVNLAAGVTSTSIFVPTGDQIVDRFVRIEANAAELSR